MPRRQYARRPRLIHCTEVAPSSALHNRSRALFLFCQLWRHFFHLNGKPPRGAEPTTPMCSLYFHSMVDNVILLQPHQAFLTWRRAPWKYLVWSLSLFDVVGRLSKEKGSSVHQNYADDNKYNHGAAKCFFPPVPVLSLLEW